MRWCALTGQAGSRQRTPQDQMILSGLYDEASLQCSLRVENATSSFNQASFTTDAIVPETAGVQGGWPIWFLYEAVWRGKQKSDHEAVTGLAPSWRRWAPNKPTGYSRRASKLTYLARPCGGGTGVHRFADVDDLGVFGLRPHRGAIRVHGLTDVDHLRSLIRRRHSRLVGRGRQRRDPAISVSGCHAETSNRQNNQHNDNQTHSLFP